MFRAPARADALANRQRLIDAAHNVFRERGLDAEMKLIAERAGVGVGTIYRNFPTKDDLITAIIAEMIDNLNDVCEEAEQQSNPENAVRHAIEGCLRTVNHYGDVVMATKQRGLPNECLALFAELNPRGRLIGILQRGIDSGQFRDDLDLEVAAALIENTLFPPTYKSLRATHSHEEITSAVVAFILQALRRC